MLLRYVLFVFCMSEVIASFKSLRAGSLHCWPDGRRSWPVDPKREHRTICSLELKAEDPLERQEGHGSRVLKRIWQNLRSTEKMAMTERNSEIML